MSLDPLQKLWQSRQLDIPVKEIMREAKAKQKRMLWFMTTDLMVWLAIVVFSAWHIHTKNTTEGFAIGLFTIVLTSLLVGYVLWLRTATWGMESLDIRNTLKLSIRRCEAGIQMGRVSTMCCIVIVLAFFVFNAIYPEYFKDKLMFTYSWLMGWTLAFFLGYHWYGKRQKQKMAHFRSLLSQLDEDNQ